ncbi:uncharacterized protein C1orf109 homolog isoform X4 [Phasianus colchicus]|uniref:uncharacterized protein C1orf109 homolog isoform X4 n=1 Tax=Phasianus colchicus TaxID=9054 RepID=UPI00129DE59C|nr:uncharacterized protein C1orf109 homolog isoform X4 [Phasianus colchicus]
MAAMAAMVAALREWTAAATRRDAAWRAAVAACAPLLVSLAGLAAQMRAAQRLAWGGTPLGAFSELRERLWRKQRGAAEALLEELCERRYLEIRQFLLLISCDSLADMEALPQAWERILERYGDDTVQGSSSHVGPKGCFFEPCAGISSLKAEGLHITYILCCLYCLVQ